MPEPKAYYAYCVKSIGFWEDACRYDLLLQSDVAVIGVRNTRKFKLTKL